MDSYFSQPALAGLTVLADYINEHPDYLDNVTIVRGLLEIYLEDDKRLKNLMLAAFLEDIPSALAENSEIKDDMLADYAVILTSDYDFSPSGASAAVAGWACILGKYPKDKLQQFVRTAVPSDKSAVSLPIASKKKEPVSYTSAMEFADVISNPALAPDPSIGGKITQDISVLENVEKSDNSLEAIPVKSQLAIEKTIKTETKELDSITPAEKEKDAEAGIVKASSESEEKVASAEIPASSEASTAEEKPVLEISADAENMSAAELEPSVEQNPVESLAAPKKETPKAEEVPVAHEEAPERALEQSRERGKKTAANWLASAVQSLGDISNERLRSYPSAPIAEPENNDGDIDELSEEELAAVEAGIKLAEEEDALSKSPDELADNNDAELDEEVLDEGTAEAEEQEDSDTEEDILDEELDDTDLEDEEVLDEELDDSDLEDEDIPNEELDEVEDEEADEDEAEEDIEDEDLEESDEDEELSEEDNEEDAEEAVAAEQGNEDDITDANEDEAQAVESSAVTSAPVPRTAPAAPQPAQTAKNTVQAGASPSKAVTSPQVRPNTAEPAEIPQPSVTTRLSQASVPQTPMTSKLSPAAVPPVPASASRPSSVPPVPGAAPRPAPVRPVPGVAPRPAPVRPVPGAASRPAPVQPVPGAAPRPAPVQPVPGAAPVPKAPARPSITSPSVSGSNRADVRKPSLESVRREAALRREAGRKDAGAASLSERLESVPAANAPSKGRDRASFEKMLFSDSTAEAKPKEQAPSGNFTPSYKKRSDSQENADERIAPSSLSAAIAAKTAKAGFASRTIEAAKSVAPAIDGPQLGAAEVSSLSEALAAKSAVDKRGFAKKITPGQKIIDADLPKLDAGGVRNLSEALAAKSVDKSRLGGASRSAFKPTESFKSSEENIPKIGTDGVRSLSEALAAKTKPKSAMSNAMRSSMIQAPSADNSLRKSAFLTSSERITVKKTVPLPNVKTYLPDCEVGDTVLFGNYCQNSSAPEPIEWYVLENADRELLLLSRFAIEAHSFNNTANGANWDECSLRFWLNGAFLKKAFSPEEQKRIVFSYNINAENIKYGTYGGENTDDKVFLLSIDEAEKFLNENMRSARPTFYASEQGAVTEGELGFCKCWLRSPGKEAGFTAIINSSGIVAADGETSIVEATAVRPAIRVKI
ncbi:MAG: DUF6273 domain-containing protein [bacterium]|nr:DUF6273 domain-containing protein [bacterium]